MGLPQIAAVILETSDVNEYGINIRMGSVVPGRYEECAITRFITEHISQYFLCCGAATPGRISVGVVKYKQHNIPVHAALRFKK